MWWIVLIATKVQRGGSELGQGLRVQSAQAE